MSKFRVYSLLMVGVLVCTLGLPGCPGKGAVTVTVSPTTATINSGQSQMITATVANDPNNQGVTWSLSSGSAGTFGAQTSTSVTYVSQSGLSTTASETVTATSIANTSATASVTITVNAILTIATNSLQVATKGVSYFGVVTATGSTGPFTWTVSSGSLPAGLSLLPSTSDSVTISGVPTTVGTSKFTMEVTANGTSVTQSLNITVNPPPPLSVATRSLPAGTVGVAYNQTLQAASGVPPYTWQLTAGALPLGFSALSSAGAISGTPTAAGTFLFTVKVTDSSSPMPQTATANLGITINPSTANNSKLNGQYAFLVSGFDPNGQFVAAGSFAADGNGHISNGVMDTNDPLALQTQLGFTGTYVIGSNNLGTMTLNITSGGVGSHSFALSLMADGSAKIIECDDSTCSTHGSGVLQQQDTSAFTTSAITGNYAFGFAGGDGAGKRYALAGAMGADGAGKFTNGFLDSDDSSSGVTSTAFTGSYAIPGVSPASGRGTMAIVAKGTTNYSFYVVSATRLLAMEIDQIAGQGSPIVSGSILQQVGSFATSSLNGTSVFETTALEMPADTALSEVGLFTTDGAGNLTVSADENNGGALTAPSSNGTYTVGNNGRVTLLNSGIGTSEPVLYLVSENQAFLVGTDTRVTFGFMQSQSPPFTIASLSGMYAGGSLAPIDAGASEQVDAASADGAGTLNFTTDGGSSSGLSQNQSSSGTYAVSANGRVVLTENASTADILYLVSPQEFYSLSAGVGAGVELFQQ